MTVLWRAYKPGDRPIVAGLLVGEDGRVKKAAPIVSWTRTMTIEAVRKALGAQGWSVEPVEPRPVPEQAAQPGLGL